MTALYGPGQLPVIELLLISIDEVHQMAGEQQSSISLSPIMLVDVPL
jgi:hypothetical protein